MDPDMVPPVAVVGMACRYPDDANSPDAFFKMLAEGRSAWSEVPRDRYNIGSYYHPSKDRIGSIRSRGAHWMKEDISVFDAPSLCPPPKRPPWIHNSGCFLKLRMNVWKAVSSARLLSLLPWPYDSPAGTPMEKLVRSNTSVYMASSSQEYPQMMMGDIENIPLYSAVGTGNTMLANRISHFYDLRGPSIALDTACSGSLVAVHLACQSIRAKESRVSIVGAGQLMIGPDGPAALSRLQFLSPTSRCHTFDESADGYSRGEGICVVMLKSLEDALLDGDTIRAVIRGTGTNQDGKTPGIVQPNSEAQASLIRSTYEAAGLSYSDTQYFEAHGTGTQIGDFLELSALASAFGREEKSDSRPLYVGSVKTNIGHLEGGAGLAGLMKTVLCLEKGVIVPHINFDTPNPKLRLQEWNLKVPTEITPWPSQGSRRASINSFGYGGSNAHCIVDDAHHYLKLHGLEGNTATIAKPPSLDSHRINENLGLAGLGNFVQQQPRLFVMSSPEQAALQRMATKHAQYLEAKRSQDEFFEQQFLSDLAFTLNSRRSLHQWRAAVVAASVGELIASLQNVGKGYRASKKSGILYVFTGQGAQWYAMGRELQRYDCFMRSVEEADRFITSLGAEWSVVKELNAPEEVSKVNLATYSQPLCTVLQIALVDLLGSWHVKPAAVCGHSSGEIAAAYACGALSAKDCWAIAYHRGRLSGEITTRAPELDGSMLSVGLSKAEVLPYLERLPFAEREQIVVACINSPSSVTLSGTSFILQNLELELKAAKVFARSLKVGVAYHSPHMRVISEDYLGAITNIQPMSSREGIVMLSSVTGSAIAPENLTADYWVRNMVSPVRFTEAVSDMLPPGTARSKRSRRHSVVDFIIEMGPHSALQGPLRQILQENGHIGNVTYASALVRGKDAARTALEVAGQLWMRGHPVNLPLANAPKIGMEGTQVVPDLPCYPWNHTHKFWHESKWSLSKRMRPTPRHDLVGYPIEGNHRLEPRWINWVRQYENPWLIDYKIEGSVIYSAASMICSVIEAAKQLVAEGECFRGVEFRDIIMGRALVVPSGSEGVQTMLHIKRRKAGTRAGHAFWYEFVLYSDQDGEGAVEHCSGLFDAQTGDAELNTEEALEVRAWRERYTEFKQTCKRFKKPKVFYEEWRSCGMHWGPSFQGIKSMQVSDNFGCTTIETTDTRSTMPEHFECEHVLHPTTLDACFQAMYGPICGMGESRVPTAINSLYVSASVPRGSSSQLCGFSSLFRKGFNSYIGETFMSDTKWMTPSIVLSGVTFTRLQSTEDQALQDKKPYDIRKIVTNLVWKEDIDLITNANAEKLFRSTLDSSRTAIEISNSHIAQWLSLSGFKLPSQRILHIGGGNGGLAAECLKRLGGEYGRTPFFALYVIADSDCSNTESERAWLDPWKEIVELKNVDIGQDLAEQGFDSTSFDVVVLESVPSADRIRTLSEILRVLVPGGKIITVPSMRGDDWIALLKEAGFADANILIPVSSQSRITISEKPSSTSTVASETLIVLPASYSPELKTLAEELCRWVHGLGITAEIATLEHATSVGLSGGTLVSNKYVVSVLEAEAPFLHKLSEEDFYRIQRLLLGGLGGIWISKGNRMLDPSGDPAYGVTQGLLRCLRNERPDVRMHEIALSSIAPIADSNAFDLITRAITSIWKAASLGKEPETELGEMNGVLYIPRLLNDQRFNEKLDNLGKPLQAKMQPLIQKGHPLRLEIGTPGMLDTLRFVHDPTQAQPLQAYEVEVEVRANGMNSADIEVSMGFIAGTKLGVDAAGVITRVGSDVTTIKPGDRVATFCMGAYRSFLRTPESLVARIPEHISFEEAASLPCAYVTAYRALVEVAHLAKGETILIHNASGGLGQAAVQLAQYIGADIFVTASHDKQQQLVDRNGISADHVFDSRDYAFAKAIKRMTNGQGVHVVLNSLSGEALRKTWDCIASFGRFIEVGKRDILRNTSLEMLPFHRNVTFAGVNMEHMLRVDNAGMARVLHAVFELLRNGSIGVVKPLTIFPFSDMERAFRMMQQGRSTAKIVLSVNADDQVAVVPRELHPVRLHRDATYIIVGGFGGVGRSLVLLLAKHGGKHVAFLSRSGAESPEAQATLAELDGLGVKASTYICDVADETSFKTTVEKIEAESPPIKGAIHAAMVLNDTLYKDMSYRQWSDTARNKVAGGWNMHQYLPEDLDFFVMLSSAAGYLGATMLSNYASGNTFLDALAQHRRSKGLAACALGLGFISGIGWAMENVKVKDEHKADYDLMSIQPAHVFSLVESAISGYAYGDTKMPAQLPTTMGTGGELQHTKFIKTRYYYADPRFAYIRRLDVREDLDAGSEQNETLALTQDLRKASSMAEAGERIEGALALKLASSMSMEADDIDTSKPVSVYGVDSLVFMEIGNWIHAVLRSTVGVSDILRETPISQLALNIAEHCALVPETVREENRVS